MSKIFFVFSNLFFVTGSAFAEGGSGGSGGLGQFMPLILLFAIFYFLLIRPQQKRLKAHREMVSALNTGDEVVTNGGIHGVIKSVEETSVTIEVAANTVIKLQRDAIAHREAK